jgi:hypothetical protein
VSPAKQKPADEMRFSSKEFDRIMGKVLQAEPKPKKAAKAAKNRRQKK